jgi:hypothetical protein
MKKLVLCGLIAASLGVTAAQAAGSATQNFTVTATIAANCTSTTVGTPNVDFGSYSAFVGPANSAPTANISFKCTRGLAITGATVSKPTSTVAGLLYTLAVDAGTKTGGSAATASAGATADQWVYVVTGTMGANQAGDSGAATTDNQVLTIAF